MATVHSSALDTGGQRLTWDGLAAGETGQRARVSWPDTITISGTFGGATVTLLGTNVPGGAGYAVHDLADAALAAISKTAAGAAVCLERFAEIWPVVTGGDGTTAIVVTVVA